MHLTKEEQLLATGKIPALFRKFAIPGVIGLLFIGLQPMIDGTVLGNYVGTEALASISIFVPIYTFMTALAVVVGVGCQAIVSMSLGSKDYTRAHSAFRTAFWSLSALALVMGCVFVLAAEPLCRFLGANEVLLPYTVSYVRAFSLFFPFMLLTFLCDYMLKAMGRPYFAMLVLGGTVLLNLLLNILFVGAFGWSTAGSGLVTGIAFTSGFAVMAPTLLKKNSLVNLRKGHFSFKLLGEMTYNGSSEGLSELSAGITVLLFNWVMMQTWGEVGVAAFTAINYLLNLGIQMFIGLSDGIVPILSFNYGAGHLNRVKATLFLGFKTNTAIGIILFCIMFFGNEFIISQFFADGGSDVLKITSIGASICAFAFLLNGSNILSSSFFTSLGDARTSVLVSLQRGLLFVVLGIMIYPILWGDNGIWLTVPLAEFFTFVSSMYLLKKRLNKWLVNIHV